MPAPDCIWLQDAGDYAAARATPEDVTWCATPVNDDDTGYVRADIHDRVVALLREALVELRAEAQGLILTEARLERREGGFVPRPETVDADACALVDPLLDLLRRAEAMVGRPPGGTPWLDDLLDGRATLGTTAEHGAF
jgi:hypothetical protein